MTIHELYDAKKEQYLKYSAEIKVYNTQLEEAREKLMQQLAILKTDAANLSNSNISNEVLVVLEKLQALTSIDDNLDIFVECKQEFERIMAELEMQIKRELND